MRKVLWIIFIVLIAIWADLNFNWTGYGYVNLPLTQEQAFSRHKTIWNWLELLIIPSALAVAAVYLNQAERKSEREVAAKQAEDTALETYLKEMSELLITQNLRKSREDDEKRTLARAWTLTIARRLSGERRGTLLQFLYEANLIHKDHPIISLSDIDLSEAALQYAKLSGVDLSDASLAEAYLFKANLNEANLRNAYLGQAHLREANLRNADLSNAFLSEAGLNGADLREANLSKANLVAADLRKANLCGANLRDVEFFYADLTAAYLRETLYDKKTEWPNNFDPAKHGAILKENDR